MPYLQTIRLLFVVVLLSTPLVVCGQANEPIKQAEQHMRAKEYGLALQIYTQLLSYAPQDPLLNYQMGLCYFYSPNQKAKAGSYFEKALKASGNQVPKEVYYYLGRCYHYSYQFLRAINMYNEYLEQFTNSIPKMSDVNRQIEIAENAIKITGKPKDALSINILDFPLNTSYNDYAPLISSNGNLLIISSSRPKNTFNLVYGNNFVYLPEELQNTEQDVYLATRKGIGWSFPDAQDLSYPVVTPLSLLNEGASMSMLLYMGQDQTNGDLYISDVKKHRWGKPKKIEGAVNSKYTERGAAFAANGNIIYFSSNRPGGYGGFDLYKAYKTGKNEWGNPVNLGPVINTPSDEVNPFLHPDNKTLYFSSNGHNTIGGLDIFKSEEVGASWNKPENLGFPINSLYDDDYFVQGPDRKYAYLSSNRNEASAVGNMDIVRIFRAEKKVPRAMISGSILAYKNGEKTPLSLSVKDLNTNTELRYVYDPDPETGKFFIIASPKRNYILSLKENGKEIYKINVDIPENTYTYHIEQELYIQPIDFRGEDIGENIEPGKTTFNVTQLEEMTDINSSRNLRYDALEGLMEMIIDRSDVQGLARLNQLEQPVEYKQDEEGNTIAYYTTLEKLVEKAIETSNVALLMSLDQLRGDGGAKVVFNEKPTAKDPGLVTDMSMFFREDAIVLEEIHKKDLDEIVDLLKGYPGINMKIAWLPNKSTQPKQGDTLTEKRIEAICGYLAENDINENRYQIINGSDEQIKPNFYPGEIYLGFYAPLNN